MRDVTRFRMPSSGLECEHCAGSWDAFEFALTSADKQEVGAGDEVRDGARDENFTGTGKC
jgi:hypothetical protein